MLPLRVSRPGPIGTNRDQFPCPRRTSRSPWSRERPCEASRVHGRCATVRPGDVSREHARARPWCETAFAPKGTGRAREACWRLLSPENCSSLQRHRLLHSTSMLGLAGWTPRCWGEVLLQRLWPFGRLSVRVSVLAVITLLSASACRSRDTTSAPAASDGPDRASAPALQIPSVPRISKWELDPENSSAAFVCKHVFSNVRGMSSNLPGPSSWMMPAPPIPRSMRPSR